MIRCLHTLGRDARDVALCIAITGRVCCRRAPGGNRFSEVKARRWTAMRPAMCNRRGPHADTRPHRTMCIAEFRNALIRQKPLKSLDRLRRWRTQERPCCGQFHRRLGHCPSDARCVLLPGGLPVGGPARRFSGVDCHGTHQWGGSGVAAPINALNTGRFHLRASATGFVRVMASGEKWPSFPFERAVSLGIVCPAPRGADFSMTRRDAGMVGEILWANVTT